MTDALCNATIYTYDAMKRMLTATAPKGGVTTYPALTGVMWPPRSTPRVTPSPMNTTAAA